MNFYRLKVKILFFSLFLTLFFSKASNFEHDIDQFRCYPEMKMQILKYLRIRSNSKKDVLDIDLQDSNGRSLLELSVVRHMQALPRFWFVDNNLVATVVNEEEVNRSFALIVALLELGADPRKKVSFRESPVVGVNKFIDKLRGAEYFVYLRKDSYWRERLKKLRKTLENFAN